MPNDKIEIRYPWGDSLVLRHPGHPDQSVHGRRKGATKVAAGKSGKGKVQTSKTGKSAEQKAAEILSKAKEKDETVTPFVNELAKKMGGKMEGLDYRIKGEGSLIRKIKSDAKDMGVSEAEAADMVTDSLRFTMTFDKSNMTANVHKVFDELGTQGWKPYDDKVKNYYKPGDAYDGLNTVIEHADGTRVEMQFHTPESLAIKHKAHKLYEKARVLPPTDPERVKLNNQMIEMWEDYDRPNDWENLPGRIV